MRVGSLSSSFCVSRVSRVFGALVALTAVAMLEGAAGAHPGAPPPPPAPLRAPPVTKAPAPRRVVPTVAAAKAPANEAPAALVRARMRAARSGDAMQAVQDFPKDREVALAAITTHEEAIKFVDGRVRRSPAFQKQAALANPFLVMPETQDPYARAAIEEAFSPKAREALLADPEVAAAVAAQRSALAKVSDLQPAIFTNRRFLAEVIANRTTPRDKDRRPVALVAYPAEDWNGQFFGRTGDLEGLTRRYRVMFYQVDSDHAFVSALADAARDKPADLVVIGGHGETALTAFGADDPAKLPAKARAQLDSPTTSPRVRQRIMDRLAKLDEERYLDLSDRAQLATVANRVTKGGAIVLISCSTGKGGAAASNLANFLHEVFPQARIDAPTEAVPNLGVKLDERGLYEDAGFADIGKRYRINPR
jgi:nucleotide-binding universal stress UspA family protein